MGETSSDSGLRGRTEATLSVLESDLVRSQPAGHPSSHYRRLAERPFTAEERDSTTILFGNLTTKHEELIKAAFQGAGYHFKNLPQPTRRAFQIGKEYCNNGLCNPNYFTAGNLIEYLQSLEASGISRHEIIERYVYFTPADCGPCRFGMYEGEYRQALFNAGFNGFRVLTFRNNKVIREGCTEPGLKFTADLGFGVLNALILGDLLFESAYCLRPYEVKEGETDLALMDCLKWLACFLRDRPPFEILERSPGWLVSRLEPRLKLKNTLNTLGKFREHLWGRSYRDLLRRCASRLDEVELDRTRPKPIVKVVGEFFSHISENDANYNIFRFLESEGAQVGVDSITSLVLYWLYKAKLSHLRRKGLEDKYPGAHWWQLGKRLSNRVAFLKKPLLFTLCDRIYSRQFHRINRALGNIAHPLIPQKDLAEAAWKYYHPLTRGGEGHLEVGKSILCTRKRLAHMVLSLKPFGCMPSTQSDGVMAAVTSQHDDLLFLSVETSGDGDINALSRVQMALADARRRARTEFEGALQATGKSLEEIRAYVDRHPELKRPSYPIPHFKGTAGVAANFVLHVAARMKRNHWGS